MDERRNHLLRAIPSVDELLDAAPMRDAEGRYGRQLVRDALGESLEAYRRCVVEDPEAAEPLEIFGLFARVHRTLGSWVRPSPRRVINATGVVLHTNLGRAPLSERAGERVMEASRSYTDLEYDVSAGERGSRHDALVAPLRRLTGAEDALVVNNNAAALLLVVNTFAADRDVLVSRGELVEIGGSFRIPEVLRSGGARLREVGTTNRTHPGDYRDAVGEATAMFLKVHHSNFRMEGFTAEVTPAEIAAMARELGVLSVFDLGSGYLAAGGLPDRVEETSIVQAVRSGMDLITFSGDKLLGGPQAGIILGSKGLIAHLRKNQLARALRVDKMTLAALSATLASYLEGRATEEIPALRMLSMSRLELGDRAEALARDIRPVFPGVVDLVEGSSRVGGGSAPEQKLPTVLVRCAPDCPGPQAWAAALRRADVPVVVRIASDSLLLDPRTLLPADYHDIADAFCRAREDLGGDSGVRSG